MGYEITKFNFQDDLASALFNAKFQEIETYLNNIQEELKNVKEENTKLKEQLDNKVEYYDNASNNVELTNKAKNTICTRPYIMTINEVTRKALGIPDTGGVYWGNILCFPNPNSSGYAYQIFYSMVSGFSCKRFAHGTLWSDWTEK